MSNSSDGNTRTLAESLEYVKEGHTGEYLVANYDDYNPNIRTGYTRLMDADSIRTLSDPVGYPEPRLYFAGEALPVNGSPTSCAYMHGAAHSGKAAAMKAINNWDLYDM